MLEPLPQPTLHGATGHLQLVSNVGNGQEAASEALNHVLALSTHSGAVTNECSDHSDSAISGHGEHHSNHGSREPRHAEQQLEVTGDG